MHPESRAVEAEPFDKIVEAHHGEIFRYLRRVILPEAIADELSQATFVYAFRCRRSLRPADVDPRSWLFTIATHLCRRYLQPRQGRAVRPRREKPRSPDVRPDGNGMRDETQSRLGAIVQSLPVTQRLALTMRKLHGLDYAAIGAGLDCSAEAARDEVVDAVRSIRRGLKRS